MKAQVNLDELGGGGSNVVSGTETVTSSGETITINTGLSSIDKFYAWFIPTGYTAKGFGSVWYDSNYSTVYRALDTTGSGAYGDTYNIGASAASRCPSLISISDGTVTLKSPTQGNGYFGNFTWYAFEV